MTKKKLKCGGINPQEIFSEDKGSLKVSVRATASSQEVQTVS
jgi:hypothetical protein